MALKSPEAKIDFLLNCMEHTEGKVNWEEVAKSTGWYKSGKFAKQAFDGIKKKYTGTVIDSGPTKECSPPKGAGTPKTPKAPKTPKRGLDEEAEPKSSAKKLKKTPNVD